MIENYFRKPKDTDMGAVSDAVKEASDIHTIINTLTKTRRCAETAMSEAGKMVMDTGESVAEVVATHGPMVGTMVMKIGYSAFEAAAEMIPEELLAQAGQLVKIGAFM